MKKAVRRNCEPEEITLDKSGANNAAADAYSEGRESPAEVPSPSVLGRHEIKYLNNIVEQDHRGIKRITKPMMGFKEFHSAQKTLAGIELWRMKKKGQMQNSGNLTAGEQFYALAA